MDFANGSYTLSYPCSQIPPGTYTVTVKLLHRLRKDILPKERWPQVDYMGLKTQQLESLGYKGAENLDSIYELVWKPINGSGLEYVIRNNTKDGPTMGSDWLSRLRPCGAHAIRGRFAGQFGRWVNLEAVPPAMKNHTNLLLLDEAFSHVYTELDCFYPLIGREDFNTCLQGKRVALIGDSTTEGQLEDILHMWYDYQRDTTGRPVDHRNYHVSKRDTALKNLSGRFSWPNIWYKPWRYGLAHLRDNAKMQKLLNAIDTSDVIVMHTCGHDLSNYDDGHPKNHVFVTFRENAKLLSSTIRQKYQEHGKQKRFIWLSCNFQVASAYSTGVALYNFMMNRIVHDEILNKCKDFIEMVDVFPMFYSSVHQKLWHHTTAEGIPTGNYHHHEYSWTLKGERLGKFGGAGYLSKVKTQRMFHQICTWHEEAAL